MAVPTDLTGKTLWLRAKDLAGADGAAVTSWADQSGLGHSPLSTGSVTKETGETPSGGACARLAGSSVSLPPLYPSLGVQATVSSNFNPDYTAASLVDGLTDTGFGWASAGAPSVGTPQWARLQLPSATVVTQYRVYPLNTSRAPKDFTFQGSNDGSSWTTLDTRTGVAWASTASKLFTFTNSTAYTYHRLHVTATQDADLLHLYEIELNETKNGTLDSPAELWMVIRATSTNSLAWRFGTGAGGDYYPFSDGKVYSAGFTTARYAEFTPTLAINQWRLIRISQNAGVFKWLIDEAEQFSQSGTTAKWTNEPQLGVSSTFDIAEVLLLTEPTDTAERADLITYFNTEHGLSVPGGVVSTPERTGSGNIAVGAGSNATAVSPRTGSGNIAIGAGSAASLVGVAAERTGSANIALSAGSTASLVGDSADQSLVSGFGFGSSLTSGVVSLQRMESGFGFGSRLTQSRDWGVVAGSTRPSPLVVITQRDGTHVVTLDEVSIGEESEGVGIVDSWRFSVDRDNERGKRIESVTHDAHLYRGNVHITKGPIGPGRLENGRMVYDVADPRWHLNSGRIITRIPVLNWIYNGDFTQGTAGWTGAFKEGSVPEAKPAFSVVDEPESTSGKGLRIEGVDKVVTTVKDVETAAVFVANEATYLSGGEAILIGQADDIPDGADIHIVGHTADRRAYGDMGDGLELSLARAQAARASLAAHNPTWTFSLLPGLKTPNENDGVVAGRGYYEQVASNSTEPESAKNRRVALHYATTQTATGHKQYVAQRRYNVVQEVDMLVPLKVTVAGQMRIGEWLGAPADGNALRVVLVDVETDELVAEATVSMSEATPRVKVQSYSADVDVPPNGRAHYISVELYPPAGWSVWSDVGMFPQEQRGYFDQDLGYIVRDLTAFVQDTHYGHGDLGIGTRVVTTGVTTTKEYPFSQLRPYSTAIEELTALARGIEVDCETTLTTATIVPYYPRQGSVADLTLAHGGPRSIVKAYRPVPASGRALASNIIAQAWGIFSNRIERYARDEAAFGGALLEAVIEADKESLPRDLQQYVDQQLARSIHPTAAWEVVIDPARTSEVMEKIGKGDRVPLILPDEGVFGLHRMVLRAWDPETDVLTLTLTPEEA